MVLTCLSFFVVFDMWLFIKSVGSEYANDFLIILGYSLDIMDLVFLITEQGD